MKKIAFTFLAIFMITVSWAQINFDYTDKVQKTESETKVVKVLPPGIYPFRQFHLGFGFGFGVINPQAINDYISNYWQNTSTGTSSTAPVVSISINYRAQVKYRFNYRFDLAAVFEGASAPAVSNDNTATNKTFNFQRWSVGLLPSFHFPFGSRKRQSLFLSLGALSHKMTFEDYKGTSIGLRGLCGVNFNFKNFNPQAFLGIDAAKAKDEVHNNFELDYSGVQFGLNFNF